MLDKCVSSAILRIYVLEIIYCKSYLVFCLQTVDLFNQKIKLKGTKPVILKSNKQNYIMT